MFTLDLNIINKIIYQDIYNPSNWPCRATAFHLLSSVLIWLYRQTCLLLFKLLLFPPCPSTCCPHCLPCQELSIRTLISQYTGASNEKTTCTASIFRAWVKRFSCCLIIIGLQETIIVRRWNLPFTHLFCATNKIIKSRKMFASPKRIRMWVLYELYCALHPEIITQIIYKLPPLSS